MEIDIDNKTYYFDIDKIFEYINFTGKNCHKETEMVDAYEKSNGELSQMSKVITETKLPLDGQIDSFRYDFIKMLINRTMGFIQDVDLWTLGDKICFQTLIESGILKNK